MREKEIIKIIDDYLYEHEFYLSFIDGEKEKKQYLAIQGLLDLYKQEKEKNKELEDVVKLMSIALTPFETPTNGVIWTSSEVRNTFFETIKKIDSERLKELLEEE